MARSAAAPASFSEDTRPDSSGDPIVRRKQFHQVVLGQELTPDLIVVKSFIDDRRGHPILVRRLPCAFLQLAYGIEGDCQQAENQQDGRKVRFAMPELPFEIALGIEGSELPEPDSAIAMLLFRLTPKAPEERRATHCN